MMKGFTSISHAILCCFCAGCIIIPIPTLEHTPKEYGVRGIRGGIEAEEFAFIQPGSTTREEVLLHLGEPDGVWPNESCFVYQWFTTKGYLVVGVYSGPIEEMPIWRKRFNMLIEFDEQGAVEKFNDIKNWVSEGKTARKPLDPAQSIKVPIKHRHRWGSDRCGDLRLGMDLIEFKETNKASHRFRTTPANIVRLTSKLPGEDVSLDYLYYTLYFDEKTELGKKFRFAVDIYPAKTMLEYLGQNCPNLVVK